MPETICLGVISGSLDWSHRQRSSGDRFDLNTAQNAIRAHTEENLRRVIQAAEAGARLVVGPEYFTGSEVFTTTLENALLLVEQVDGKVVAQMKTIAGRYDIAIAASMSMAHDNRIVQTGVLIHPDGITVTLQPKISILPKGDPLDQGFQVVDLEFARTAIFTCSDLTDFLETEIVLAKEGLQLMLVPGCGFAGEDWFHYLKTRSIDLSLAIAYADDGRSVLIDRTGTVQAESRQSGEVLTAKLSIPPRLPSSSSLNSKARSRD